MCFSYMKTEDLPHRLHSKTHEHHTERQSQLKSDQIPGEPRKYKTAIKVSRSQPVHHYTPTSNPVILESSSPTKSTALRKRKPKQRKSTNSSISVQTYKHFKAVVQQAAGWRWRAACPRTQAGPHRRVVRAGGSNLGG